MKQVYLLEGQQLRLLLDLAERSISWTPLVQSHPSRRAMQIIKHILKDGPTQEVED